MFLKLYILVLLFCSSLCIYNHEDIIEITSLDELLPVVSGQSDYLGMVIYVHEDCKRCHQMGDILYKFIDKFADNIKFYAVDCQIIWNDEKSKQSLPMCDPKYTQELPMISFFEPPVQKINPYTQRPMMAKEHKFQGQVSEKDFAKFVKNLIPAYRKQIKTIEEFNEFTQDTFYPTKVILFTNKKDTSNLYKAITTYFNEKLDFGEVQDSLEEVVKQFQVNKYPSLFVLKQEGDKLIPSLYEGELSFEKIVKYLKRHALEDKKARPQDVNKQQQQQQQSNQKEGKKDEKKKKELVIPDLKIKKYEKKTLQDNRPYLIHAWDKKNNQSHPSWQECLEKYEGIFEFLQLDIGEEENKQFAENTLQVGKFPSIKYLPYENFKKPTNRIYFGPQLQFEQIKAEISEFISDASISVNDQMLQMQIQAALQQNIITIILFHNKEQSPLSYRALTHEESYKKKFLFLNYRNAPQQVLQQFGVQEQPRIIIVFRDIEKGKEPTDEIKQEEIKVAHYQGRFQFQDFQRFINQFIQRDGGTTGKSSKEIKEIKSQDDFEQVCQDKNSLCFLALLNGSPEKRLEVDDNDSALKEQLKIFEKIKDKYGNRPIGFAWIDGICHSEILGSINLGEDDIPNMISYSNTNKQFSNLIGRFDQDSLNYFAGNVIQGKSQKNQLNLSEFQIKDKNCEEEHEKIKQRRNNVQKQDDEDDEILREILEESRKRELEREQELKNDKKKKKDKKKDKKKNKKSDL